MPRADWPAPGTPRTHWPAPASPLRPRYLRVPSLTATLLYFTFLTDPLLARADWSSSTAPRAPPPDAAELVRDAPLYPPLSSDLYDLEPATGIEQTYNDLETSIEDSNIEVTPDDSTRNTHTEHATDGHTDKQSREHASRQTDERAKRSSEPHWDNNNKPSNRRVKTGDTILNIRGAVRDAIGDAGAAPGPRASSRLDTFVIRPAAARDHPSARTEPDAPRALPTTSQTPKNERELLVEAHSRARIVCDLNNVTDLRWYKDNEQMNAASSPGGGEAIWQEAGALVIARATRADAAAWRCAGVRAGTTTTLTGKPTRLLIYEPVRSVFLSVDGRRLDAGNTWVPVRDKTLLEVRCVAEGGVPPPELSWRLLALEPALDHRPYLRIHPTNYSLEGVSWSHVVVTAARELHNATLQCEARQRTPTQSAHTAHTAPAGTEPPADPLTAKLEIHVTYPPSFVISRWPGFGVSLSAGGAAALRCDVDANPPARAWWLRDDAHTSSSPPPPVSGDEARGSATLRWGTLRAAHAGWYRCRATWLDTEYSSIGYYLNVIPQEEAPVAVTEAGPEQSEPADQQRVEVPVGGNVQLHCPKGSVGCWWRRVVGNSSDVWAPAGSHHAHGVLGIKDALYQEGGEYRCIGARGPDMNRLKELKRVTVRVTGIKDALYQEGGEYRCIGARGPDMNRLKELKRVTVHVTGIKDALYQEGGEYRCIGARGPDMNRLKELKRVTVHVTGGATATAVSAVPTEGGAGRGGGWRLECGACGRGVRVLWVRPPTPASPPPLPAALTPDLAQHCWRAVLQVQDPDEVWCVAVTASGGAVAVFPPRAPPPSPAPARHTVTALLNAAPLVPRPHTHMALALTLLLFLAHL